MFIITAKVNRRRIAAGAAAAVLLCAAAAAAFGFPGGSVEAISAPVDGKGVRTNEDRIAYLERYGWRVRAEPVSVEELVIPEEFDDTYTQYLELQTSQGFNLKALCGKRVKRYTYALTNYPTGETGVLAGLLIYKNTVVGGDVLSSDLGGFIHGLTFPS